MMRNGLMRVLLTVSLVITIPAAGAAQDGGPGPEGERWDLVAYGVDGLGPVPWNIDAALLLEDGVASGSTGCDRFSGDYELAAETLSFAAALDVTQEACVGGAAAVEAGYLAALPQVVTWAIVDEQLQLADATGSVILVFEQPVVGLTASDIAGLVAVLDNQRADLERLDDRLDRVGIGKLRDRIKALEAQVDELKAVPAATTNKTAGRFNASENVLLDAIPSKIRQTCTPRRDQNPSGTVAAVQCAPPTATVRDMAYYLMEGSDAMDVWQQRMDENGVKDRDRSCTNGKAGLTVFTGGYMASGCYINDDSRASLRYVVPAWDNCGTLKAGGKRVDSPVLYVAVLGPNDDLAKLANWADPKADARPTSLYQRQRANDACTAPPPM